MHLLRSILFALVLTVITVPYAFFATLIFWLPPMTRHRLITSWVPIMMWVIRHVLGIRYRVIGAENIPAGPAVVLSKHQSAWETIALQVIFPPLCYVLKRELLRVPFFGWALGRIPGIAIDRSAGKDALTQVVEQGRERLKEGLWVVVFPEGTRVAPGATLRYKPGGAILAKRAGVPVVPVAHSTVLAERIRTGGGDVELCVYPGEGHGFRLVDHQLDEYARTDAFLRRHVS